MANPFNPVLERVREISPFHHKIIREMDLAEQAFYFGKEEAFARVFYVSSKEKFRIEFTPRMFTMDVETQAFTLMHEVEHVLRGHMVFPKYATPRRWNIAGDACINTDLIDDYFTGRLLDATFVNVIVTHGRLDIDEDLDTIDSVYRVLPPDPELDKLFPDNTPTLDDIGGAREGSDAAEEMEEVVEDLVREISRTQGEGFGDGVPRRFKKLFAPKHKARLDYKNLLQEAFGQVKPMPMPTFSKINMRKYISQGLIAPGTRMKRTPKIFIGCDTSGSVKGYVPWFMVEIRNCLTDLDAQVDMFATEGYEKSLREKVVATDMTDEWIEEFTKDDARGGCTHYDWIYPKLIEMDEKYDLVILFTDCYNNQPPFPLHSNNGRTVILNVGHAEVDWPHCEVYKTNIPNKEWQ